MRNRSLIFKRVLVAPPCQPEADRLEVFENKIGRVEHERLPRHAAVRDHGGLGVQQSNHVRGRPAANTVERHLWFGYFFPQAVGEFKFSEHVLGVHVFGTNFVQLLIQLGLILSFANYVYTVYIHEIAELNDGLAHAAVGAVLNDRVARLQTPKVFDQPVGRYRIDRQC